MDSEAASARFEQLFRDNYERVLSYAKRRLPPSIADDVVAETFLIAWKRLDSIPRDELPWLLGVARRVHANQRRRDETRERAANRFAAEPAAPNEVRDAALDPELSQAFTQLDERDQELLRLIAWEGLAPAEAGRVLGWSPVRARVRLHRARARLQSLLQHPDMKQEKRWKPDPTS
jgi:RNA polymerase sigma-70 factor, ECF subfamily